MVCAQGCSSQSFARSEIFPYSFARNMNKKLILIIGVILVLAGSGVFYWYRSRPVEKCVFYYDKDGKNLLYKEC